MAGNYPDVPSWRIPYSIDGTLATKVDHLNVVTDIANSELLNMNNESDSDNYGLGIQDQIARICLLFPRLMDIDAMYLRFEAQYNSAPNFQTSANTTNGFDGTWTNFTPTIQEGGTTIPAYRTAIWSGTIGGVRGLRMSRAAPGWVHYIYTWHIYGEPTAGEDANRLEVWSPTLDQRLAPAALDWGNCPRSSSEDRTFRIKNLSPTLTANSVRIAFDAPTDTTPSVAGQMTVSEDGTNFYAQRTITSIAPGATSAVYTIRRTTPSNAQLSLWTARMLVEATAAWT